MAINKISGNILADNLQRGSDLAFQGNLLYIDVQDTRVGINTASTTHTLTVQGNTNISDTLFADVLDANTLIVANINIGNLVSGGNLTVNSLLSNTFVQALGNVQAGNLVLTEDTVTLAVAGNITITPTGNNLVVIDTTSGLILPRGDDSQRPAPAQTGTVRFNTDSLRVEVYDGTGWQGITANVTNQTETGDGSTVQFALDRNSTTAGTLISLNGVVQLPVTAYAVSGNVLTFTEAPLSTDVIDIRFL